MLLMSAALKMLTQPTLRPSARAASHRLNGADGAVEVGVAVMGASQYDGPAALAVASDAKVDGCGTSVANAARSTLQRWARCGISPLSRFSGPSASTKRAETR